MAIVFDKFWFQKHQSKILWLANSWLGKYIFQFRKMGHYLENPIVKITPCSVAERLEDGQIREHFFVRNEYARKLYFYLYPIWLTMHIWDWFMADHFRLAPQLSFGFSTLTVSPGSIGAENPVDGTVRFTTDNLTWAEVRDATDGTSKVTNGGASSYVMRIKSGTNSNTYQSIYRAITCFDTSALTAGATISATTFSFYANAGGSDEASWTPDINVYTANPAATNALAVADYDQIGAVAQCDTPVTYSGWNTSAGYKDFTFNATGIGNVSKTGISKFGLRNANYDVANSAPTWSTVKESRYLGTFSPAGENMPKLVITYTVPATVNTGAFFNFFY